MTTTERLSDGCGFLQVAKDWNVPYHVPLLIADYIDTIQAGQQTNLHQRRAWKEANALIRDLQSFARFMAVINYLRDRMQRIKAGLQDPFERTFYEVRP